MKRAITETPTMRGNTGAGVNSCSHGRVKRHIREMERHISSFNDIESNLRYLPIRLFSRGHSHHCQKVLRHSLKSELSLDHYYSKLL